ncbi:hypothetical protein D3C81_1723820 [compost metagenome]
MERGLELTLAAQGRAPMERTSLAQTTLRSRKPLLNLILAGQNKPVLIAVLNPEIPGTVIRILQSNGF